MGRKKRRHPRPAAKQAATATIDDSQWSGYDAANQSLRRGQIFWPTQDTRKEIDSFSRREIQRRVRWLFANVGFLRGFVRNSATLVGSLTPQARSKDREWNRKQERLFKQRTRLATNFDRAGKFNFHTAQLMIQRRSRIDGDILTVLTTNDAKTAPMVAFYEAHQLCDPKDAGQDWVDGVKIGPGGRHLAYGLKGDGEKVTVVPAASVIYFGAFDSPGHVRAISPFAHAVNHSIDVTEIRADTKHNIKAAAQVGIAAYTETSAPGGKVKEGMPGVLSKRTVATPDGDGGTTTLKMETRDIYGGSSIAELPPGKKLDILHDSRPSPNQMLFMDELIRDISVGFGLPPEVIYKMINLTGPGVRFVMEYAARWIGFEQDLLAEWALRVVLYFTAWDIARGNLAVPQDEDGAWMEFDFIPQRDLTIDRGRDGRLEIEMLDRGLGSEAEFYRRWFGMDFEDVVREHVRNVKFKMEACEEEGVPFETAYPPRAGAAAPNSSGEGDEEEEEEESTEEEKP